MITIDEWSVESEEEFRQAFTECELCKPYPSALDFICQTINWNKVTSNDPLIIDFEHPYIDKDYLSTFYEHHVKKFFAQPKVCTRVHFYAKNVSDSGYNYCGYIVLRPNENGIHIGRTYLSPHIVLDHDYELIMGEFGCDILGKRYNWYAYPFMMQEGDFDVCAHIAVWTVIRYYGNSYRSFADTLLGNIVNRAENNYGRTLSSIGLDIRQIADLMSVHSHTPIIVRSTDLSPNGVPFRNEMISYIESGIPFVGFLSKKEHAVCVMGHTKPHTEWLDDELFVRRAKTIWEDDYRSNVDGTNHTMPVPLPIVDYASLIDGLYIMDDNKVPYRCIKDYFEKPSQLSAEEWLNTDYCIYHIDIAIVPLNREMQLGYMTVHSKFLSLYADCVQYCLGAEALLPSYAGLKPNIDNIEHSLDYASLAWSQESRVFRIYIASSNSLKEFYREIESDEIASPEFFQFLCSMSLPKFVWCIELGTFSEIANSMISGLILADATAGNYKAFPWLFIQGQKVIYTAVGNGEMEVLETDIRPYPSFKKHLRG